MADRSVPEVVQQSGVRTVAEYVEIHGPVEARVFETAVRTAVGENETLTARPSRLCPQWTFRVVDVGAEADPVAAAVDWMRADLGTAVGSPGDPAFGHALFLVGPAHFLWYQRAPHGLSLARRVAEVYHTLVDGGEPTQDGHMRAVPEWEAPVVLANRPGAQAGTGARDSADLAVAEVAALVAVAAEAGATIGETLIAAFAAYAHRMTGATESDFALPVPGTVTDVQPQWVRADPGASLLELAATLTVQRRGQRPRLDRRHDQSRGASTPFGRSARPLDRALRFTGGPEAVHPCGDVLAEDLVLLVDGHADSGGLRLTVEADSRRATQPEVAAHLRRFLSFLHRTTAAPTTPVADIDLLLAGERHLLVGDWDDAVGGVPPDTVPELFEAQAAAKPDQAALVTADGTLTFAALNRRANELARLLVEEGAAPELYVGLLLAPDADALPALLAVLKAGAGYVLLDSEQPTERLARLLADSAPVVLLTSRRLRATAESAAGSGAIHVVVLDEPATAARLGGLCDRDLTEGERRAPLIPQTPSCLVHAGEPDGVVIEHRGLVDLLRHRRDVLIRRETAATGRGVQRLALSPSLSAGACWAGARWLSSLLDGQAVRLVDQGGPEPACPPERRADLLDRVPACAAGSDLAPFAATTAYVLDGRRRLVPPGGVGELYLGGQAVTFGHPCSRGPEAERFLDDPFGSPGERMYRTGELARWRQDGTLECLGGAGEQVASRGFRIELGEIGSVAAGRPEVA